MSTSPERWTAARSTRHDGPRHAGITAMPDGIAAQPAGLTAEPAGMSVGPGKMAPEADGSGSSAVHGG